MRARLYTRVLVRASVPVVATPLSDFEAVMGAVSSITRRPRRRRARHMLELWRLFRDEPNNPGAFYRQLATDAVADLEQRHGALAGRRIADIGCGPGYYTRAFAASGAVVVPIERDQDELETDEALPSGAILGDATQLPLRSSGVDGVFCSNMLEHTPDPARVIDEIVRVLRPGGWSYVSFTNWCSPWGGHEMSPYHLLGSKLGPKVYERRHGTDHKHRVGVNLFPLHIGHMLRVVRSRDDVRVHSIEARYWPFLSFVTRIPGVRELVTWNCVIRLSKV
jgi:SAM-dependent methyltransferase